MAILPLSSSWHLIEGYDREPTRCGVEEGTGAKVKNRKARASPRSNSNVRDRLLTGLATEFLDGGAADNFEDNSSCSERNCAVDHLAPYSMPVANHWYPAMPA